MLLSGVPPERLQTDRDAILDAICRYGARPFVAEKADMLHSYAPLVEVVDKGTLTFGLSKTGYLALEGVVFAVFWPEWHGGLLAAHTVVDVPPLSEEVAAGVTASLQRWAIRVRNSIAANRVEVGLQDLFLSLFLPQANAVRIYDTSRCDDTSRTVYQRYRDLNTVIPQIDFRSRAGMSGCKTPHAILCNAAGCVKPEARMPRIPQLENVALLATFSAYAAAMFQGHTKLKVAVDGYDSRKPVVVTLKSIADSGMNWCDPFDIYYTQDVVYICEPVAGGARLYHRLAPRDENATGMAGQIIDVYVGILQRCCLQSPEVGRLRDVIEAGRLGVL